MKDNLRDCYFSPKQYKLMKLLGCRMEVSLNGQPISQIFNHGETHELLDDEKFVGTAALEDIDCIEN